MSWTDKIASSLRSEVGLLEGFRGVRLPEPVSRSARRRGLPQPRRVSWLWTSDGLRPRPDNLALLMLDNDLASSAQDWRERLCGWGAGGLVVPLRHGCYFLLREGNEVRARELSEDELIENLKQCRAHLFTPRALSRLARGQLTFADTEARIAPSSFSFLLRERDLLVEQVQKGITEAIRTELEARKKAGTDVSSGVKLVMSVALAYLAARILEDKGAFGSDVLPENDPLVSLNRAVQHVNGFLSQASLVVNDLRHETQETLGHYLGVHACFALMDYHHIGQLYEQMIHLPELDLQAPAAQNALHQHYTPTHLASRLLEHLPLERIRPENRVVFDPAAGSGSLLLAATRRLAALTDLPAGTEAQRQYLSQRVVGNDLDPQAELLTRLKYYVLNSSSELPFPAPRFIRGNYLDLDAKTLVRELDQRPSIFVANPPFGEEGTDREVQLAARFVEQALDWMVEGDQFGFILPQTLLQGESHGSGTARRRLLTTCKIFDIWELPEKAVGLSAQQATCVILGSFGRDHLSACKRRTLLPRPLAQAARKGFLGAGWLDLISNADQVPGGGRIDTAPAVVTSVPTVKLGERFHVFIGVLLKPGAGQIGAPEPGIWCRRYWQQGWREEGRLITLPDSVPEDRRWLRYVRENTGDSDIEGQKEFVKRPEWNHRYHFDAQKLMIGRSTNRDSAVPMPILFDPHGLVPNSDIYCVWTSRVAATCALRTASKGKANLGGARESSEGSASLEPFVRSGQGSLQEKTDAHWAAQSDEDQLLWLLGILISDLGQELATAGRSSRHIGKSAIEAIPLPRAYDQELVDEVRRLIDEDRRRVEVGDPASRLVRVNARVNQLYNNPPRLPLTRYAAEAAHAQWTTEAKKPALLVTGQVLEVLSTGIDSRVRLSLSGLTDEEDKAILPLPPELPGWALCGQVFTAELSRDVETFAQLRDRPWALRSFVPTSRPYLSADELRFLGED